MNLKTSILLILPLLTPLMAMCASASRSDLPNGVIAGDEKLVSYLRELPKEKEESPIAPTGNDPLYEKAKAFSQWVNNELPPEQVKALKKACKRHPKGNPFCFSIKRLHILKSRKKDLPSTRMAIQEKKDTVVSPTFGSTGKITNWRTLRRAEITSLLKGIESLPVTQLETIATRALKERHCPNNIAIATAATLEDHFPDITHAATIAKLYAKVSGCFRRRSSDREHFLTRSGLLYVLAGDLKMAERVLRQVHPTDAYVGRAWYWLYRVRKEMGHPKTQATLKRLLAKHPMSFHALVAALQTSRTPEQLFYSDPKEIKKRSKYTFQTNLLLEQIETLKKYGFERAADFLVKWASDRSRRIEPPVKLYLAELGSPYFKVTQLPALFIRKPSYIFQKSMVLAYPQPYPEHFQSHSFGGDPLLMYSIARKESKFDPQAVSRAGAKGLMQINPDTAALLTGGMDVDLYQPGANIAIGGYYVGKLLERMEGRPHWAIAAYNAGEVAANSWIKRFGMLDPVMGIDLITYRETRNYVGMVLANYFWYSKLYGSGNPLSYFSAPSEIARLPQGNPNAKIEVESDKNTAAEAEDSEQNVETDPLNDTEEEAESEAEPADS